jgi:ribosomal L20-like protein
VDSRAALAREKHRSAARLGELADRERVQRDHLVRELRKEDPGQWSYKALAEAIGCSQELIAVIVKKELDRDLVSWG